MNVCVCLYYEHINQTKALTVCLSGVPAGLTWPYCWVRPRPPPPPSLTPPPWRPSSRPRSPGPWSSATPSRPAPSPNPLPPPATTSTAWSVDLYTHLNMNTFTLHLMVNKASMWRNTNKTHVMLSKNGLLFQRPCAETHTLSPSPYFMVPLVWSSCSVTSFHVRALWQLRHFLLFFLSCTAGQHADQRLRGGGRAQG